MEERLMQAGLGLATTPPSFRPTTVLFTDATNNTMQPQTFCDGMSTTCVYPFALLFRLRVCVR